MEEKKNTRIKENSYKNIKSNYILKKIFDYLTENNILKIVKYNKNIQKKLGKDINDYIKYCQIIIELTPIKANDKNIFIKYKEKEKQYYHIYFNDEKEEKHRNYYNKDENVTKIKIIINAQIKSFKGLFYHCCFIEKINFIQFNRENITLFLEIMI